MQVRDPLCYWFTPITARLPKLRAMAEKALLTLALPQPRSCGTQPPRKIGFSFGSSHFSLFRWPPTFSKFLLFSRKPRNQQSSAPPFTGTILGSSQMIIMHVYANSGTKNFVKQCWQSREDIGTSQEAGLREL